MQPGKQPRRRTITSTGQVLERAYIYIPPNAWEAVEALSRAADTSLSEYIASLIFTADLGSKYKGKNDYNNC